MANERRIYGFIRSLVLNAADADDLFQSSAAVLWEKFDEFDAGTDFASWALTVARFQVLAFRKKHRTSPQFGDDLFDRLAACALKLAPEADRRKEALRDCLNQLTPTHRQLIEARYEEGMTLVRLAQRIGHSAPTVCRNLQSIHQILHGCILRKLAGEQ